MRRAARLFLSERFEAMWACLPAALAGEAETGIHDMRVEAKRLREAMRLFAKAYRTADFEFLLGEVDKLNDRLGSLREADVLRKQLANLPGDEGPELLTPLSDELAAQREIDHQTLLEYLARLQAQDFAGEFRRLIRAGRQSRRHRVAGARLDDFAPLEVGRRLRKVVKRLRAAQGEADSQGMHEARIANKHLRYAMETFSGIYDRRFDSALERVAELHSALGDVHDIDVLLQTLARAGEAALQAYGPAISAKRERLFGRLEHLLTPAGIKSFGRLVTDALD